MKDMIVIQIKKVENMKFEYKTHAFQKFLALNMNKRPWQI